MIGKRKRIRIQLRRNPEPGPHYYASCYGKIRRTKYEANEESRLNTAVKPYKCHYCNFYHVGRREAYKKQA